MDSSTSTSSLVAAVALSAALVLGTFVYSRGGLAASLGRPTAKASQSSISEEEHKRRREARLLLLEAETRAKAAEKKRKQEEEREKLKSAEPKADAVVSGSVTSVEAKQPASAVPLPKSEQTPASATPPVPLAPLPQLEAIPADFKLRIQFVAGREQLFLTVSSDMSVGALKARLAEECDGLGGFRLVFAGSMLQNDGTALRDVRGLKSGASLICAERQPAL